MSREAPAGILNAIARICGHVRKEIPGSANIIRRGSDSALEPTSDTRRLILLARYHPRARALSRFPSVFNLISIFFQRENTPGAHPG